MKKSLLFLILPVFLLGVIVFAEDNNGTGDTNDTGNRQNISDHTGKDSKKLTTPLSTDSIACVTAAITKRDTAIKGWMTTYYTVWTAAFDARTAALTAAISLANKKDMKKTMDLALKTSDRTITAAQKVKKNVVQKSWNAYRADLKACNTDTAKGLMQERGGNDLND